MLDSDSHRRVGYSGATSRRLAPAIRWRGLPRGLLAQPASATCTTRSPGRPSGEERVDVVESDAERKRVPLILQRQSHILRKHVPLSEPESSPEKLAPGRPAAGRCRTEEQVAVDAFRRRPGEKPLFGLASREGFDNSFDFLLESGAQVEVARTEQCFLRPATRIRPSRAPNGGGVRPHSGRVSPRAAHSPQT